MWPVVRFEGDAVNGWGRFAGFLWKNGRPIEVTFQEVVERNSEQFHAVLWGGFIAGFENSAGK